MEPNKRRPVVDGTIAPLEGKVFGIALLVGTGGSDSATGIDPFGALMILVSAGSWAVGSLLSRRVTLPESPFLGAAMNLFSGGVMLLILSLVTSEWTQVDWAAVSVRSVAAVMYLAVGSSVIAFGSYMWLLAHVSPSRLGTYAYVNPVIAVFLGWILVGEELTGRTLIAAAVIIGAVFLITTAGSKPADGDVKRPFVRSVGATLKSYALRVVSGLMAL